MSNNFYVYLLRRPDKEDPFEPGRSCPFYVGKGHNGRIGKHKWEAKNLLNKHEHKTIKIKIIHKLWEDGLNFEEDVVLCSCTEEEAFMYECQMIDAYGRIHNSTGCLANLTSGGEGSSGAICSEETRRKLVESHKGKSPSVETRKKMGEAQRKRTYSEETRRNMGEAKRGTKHPHSEETKHRISEALKGNSNSTGNIYSEERKKKMSEIRKGRPWSEAKRKSLETYRHKLKHPLSEEHKRKLSESHKGKYRGVPIMLQQPTGK